MDPNEIDPPKNHISHILSEQIQKDFDGIGKAPKVELLTAGADSHIYLIKTSGHEPLIAKLYDVSPVLDHRYKNMQPKPIGSSLI